MTRRHHLEELPSAFVAPRRLPQHHYIDAGRAGGHAKAAAARRRRGGLAPSLRAVIDRTDLRRAAAASFVHALGDLHAARAFAVDAYWSGDAGAIRRALRWVAAANALADHCYEELVAVGGQ